MPRPRRETSPDERQATLLLARPRPSRAAHTRSDREDGDRSRPEPAGDAGARDDHPAAALPRAALVRLRARAIPETRKLEAIIREILEDAAK
jgi:hypothetical protein